MVLVSFDIQNIRALRGATCEAVPRIMIVAGPNGIGKSTMLHAISRRQGTQEDHLHPSFHLIATACHVGYSSANAEECIYRTFSSDPSSSRYGSKMR